MNKKVYVVGNSLNYSSFIKNCELVDTIKEADIVLFTGGEDVSPSLYGCKKHRTTFSNIQRDIDEAALFFEIPKDKLVIGICRGSQLICALNGGLLVQNVDNHALGRTHTIENSDGVKYEITSTHHQMQYPYNLHKDLYSILYWANRSNIHEGDKIEWKENYVEPEIVLYHNNKLPKCLAIQGHPEMMSNNSAVVLMLNELIDNLLK